MKKKSKPGLHRFRLEIESWSSFADRVAELDEVIAKTPETLLIEIGGTDELSPDAALRFRAVLQKRSPKTQVVTHAHSSLQGGAVLLWLLGDKRTVREDARFYFRRSTLAEDADATAIDDDSCGYWDPYSAVDPDEGDYARVLEIINEYLPVRELAGRLIGVPVLRQFGLIESDRVEALLANLLAKKKPEHSPEIAARARRKPDGVTLKMSSRQARQ